jgi:hypothetical protein
MVLPQLTLFQQVDVETAVAPVTKFLAKSTNQKYLTQWYRMTSGERMELARLRTAYRPLETRLAHLAPVEHQGPHQPFDLNPKKVIKFQPNSFIKTILPTKEGTMSQYQMSLYLKLLLGLPIPVPVDSVSACPCGHTHDFHGYHRLNCKHHAGRANRAAHDLVQQALKREFQRLGIQVVDNDNDMRQRFLICPLRSEGIWPFYLRVTILFMIRSVNNPSRKLLQM